MLQRIQTVFLIIAAIGAAIFLGTTSWTKTISTTEQVVVNPLYFRHLKGSLVVSETPIYYVATLAGIALLVTIFSIFQYKNRVRQMLFVALNSMLFAAALSAIIYHITRDGGKLGDPNDIGNFGIGIVAILVSLVANFLANRFIKRDEKLVKSADRMR